LRSARRCTAGCTAADLVYEVGAKMGHAPSDRELHRLD
jgi:hypothetical protein